MLRLILLFPFAILYDLITNLRNHLYNIGSKRSFKFDAKVISVGNLSVGGTGKTPMIIFLVHQFILKNLKIAILSRGYGRKSKGFRIANPNDNALVLGDESAVYNKLFQKNKNIVVAVGESRALAIPEILSYQPNNDYILLDDAFQHRSVVPSISILLTPYSNPFFLDFVLPSGNLRESRTGAKRADIIVVTKCPENLTNDKKLYFTNNIKKYNSKASIFFSYIDYLPLLPIFSKKEEKQKIILVNSIANPKPFEKKMEEKYEVVAKFNFKDHHYFSNKDIEKIKNSMLEYDAMLICTEKDAIKLQNFNLLENLPCYFCPISIKLFDEEEAFIKQCINI